MVKEYRNINDGLFMWWNHRYLLKKLFKRRRWNSTFCHRKMSMALISGKGIRVKYVF